MATLPRSMAVRAGGEVLETVLGDHARVLDADPTQAQEIKRSVLKRELLTREGQPLSPRARRQRAVRGNIVFAFAVALALYTAWQVRDVLEIIYVSALFAVVLMPVMRGITKLRIGKWNPGRGSAIFILLLAVAGGGKPVLLRCSASGDPRYAAVRCRGSHARAAAARSNPEAAALQPRGCQLAQRQIAGFRVECCELSLSVDQVLGNQAVRHNHRGSSSQFTSCLRAMLPTTGCFLSSRGQTPTSGQSSGPG